MNLLHIKRRERTLLYSLSAVVIISFLAELMTKLFSTGAVLVLIDISLFSLSIFYILKYKYRYLENSLIKILPFLLILLPALALATFYGKFGSFFLNIAGLKSYILPILILPIGFYIGRNLLVEGTFKSIERFTSVAITSLVGLAIIQALLFILGIEFLPSREHTYHSYNADEIQLFSSVFSSSKRFARVILTLYLFNSFSRYSLGKNFGYLPIIVLFGLVLSASREALLFCLLIFTLQFFRSHGKISYQGALVSLISLSFFIAKFKQILYLGKYYLGLDSERWAKLVEQIFPFSYVHFNESFFISGIGPGRIGPESRLIGIRDEIEAWTGEVVINYIPVMERYIFDSAIFRIWIELGILGLIAFICFAILIFLQTILSKNKSSLIKSNMELKLFFLFFLLIFLKGHQALSDIFFATSLYFSLGIFYGSTVIRRLRFF